MVERFKIYVLECILSWTSVFVQNTIYRASSRLNGVGPTKKCKTVFLFENFEIFWAQPDPEMSKYHF